MGNWRRVHIIGTCVPYDVPALARAIDPGKDYENFHCLSASGGIMALPRWAREKIDVTGNLAERNYSPDDVGEVLRGLRQLAPSLRVKVHCGGEYESERCVNTVTCDDDGVRVGPPEVLRIGDIPESQMHENMADQLRRSQQGT